MESYRARLDNLPFLVSFDKLAMTIVNEIWQVISAPTVFLAVTLALVLIAYRKQLSPLLPKGPPCAGNRAKTPIMRSSLAGR